MTELRIPHHVARSLPSRFMLGVVVPQVLFYLALRSGGLIEALVIAGGWTAGLQVCELVRRRALDPFLVYGLLFTLAQGAAAFSTDNASVFVGAGIAENVMWAGLFLGTAAFCRPLLVRGLNLLAGGGASGASLTPAAQAALWSVALLWGVLFLVRAAALYVALTHLPIGQFLVVNTVAGWPVNGLGVLMSLRYVRIRV